jgi:hypothetical protein
MEWVAAELVEEAGQLAGAPGAHLQLGVAGEPTGHEPTIADSGDVTALSEVVEQWWWAARLEHRGGEGWQRQRRLIEQGRWNELLAASEPVDVDAMLRESRP